MTHPPPGPSPDGPPPGPRPRRSATLYRRSLAMLISGCLIALVASVALLAMSAVAQ